MAVALVGGIMNTILFPYSQSLTIPRYNSMWKIIHGNKNFSNAKEQL